MSKKKQAAQDCSWCVNTFCFVIALKKMKITSTLFQVSNDIFYLRSSWEKKSV